MLVLFINLRSLICHARVYRELTYMYSQRNVAENIIIGISSKCFGGNVHNSRFVDAVVTVSHPTNIAVESREVG